MLSITVLALAASAVAAQQYSQLPTGGVMEQLVDFRIDSWEAQAFSSASVLQSYDVADLEGSAAWFGGAPELEFLRTLQQEGPYAWPAVKWLIRVLASKWFDVDLRQALLASAPTGQQVAYRSVVALGYASVALKVPMDAAAFIEQLGAAEGDVYLNKVAQYARAMSGASYTFDPPLYVTGNFLNYLCGGCVAADGVGGRRTDLSGLLQLDGSKRTAGYVLANLLATPQLPAARHPLPALVLMLEEEYALNVSPGAMLPPWDAASPMQHLHPASLHARTALVVTSLSAPVTPDVDVAIRGALAGATVTVVGAHVGVGALLAAWGLADVHVITEPDAVLPVWAWVGRSLPLAHYDLVALQLAHIHGPGQLWSWEIGLEGALARAHAGLLVQCVPNHQQAMFTWMLAQLGVQPAEVAWLAQGPTQATLFVDTHATRRRGEAPKCRSLQQQQREGGDARARWMCESPLAAALGA